MGIKDFNKNICSLYPDAFKTTWLESYDYVYIDLNFALHYCSHEVTTNDDIYYRLFKFIENILLEVNPTKKVYFATDGSAPLAKLLLQRERRSRNKNSSSIQFTPGTQFMSNLKSETQLFMTYLSHVFNIKVEFLDEINDEAELKLKKKIMDNSIDDGSTHLFVSNDADVILMLTTLENYSNVFIYDKKCCHTLSICKLLDLHTDRVGLTENAGLDFTAINLMLGNDYLPKISYIDFNKLWDAYKSISTLNNEGLVNLNDKVVTINQSFFLKLMNQLISKMKPTFLNKPHPQELMSSMYENYYDGYAWCLTTYVSGICSRYNYMYGFSTTPHPLGLAINFFHMNSKFQCESRIESQPLPPELYSILLLPKSQKCLINKRYHKFLNLCDILYVEESCERCKMFVQKISEESKLSKTQHAKLYALHKKQHAILTLDDITEIANKFNCEFM